MAEGYKRSRCKGMGDGVGLEVYAESTPWSKFYYQRILCLKTNPRLKIKLNYINAFDKVPCSDKLTATLIRLVCSTFRIFKFTTYLVYLRLDIVYIFTRKEENNYLQKLYGTYKVDINETNLLRLIIRRYFRHSARASKRERRAADATTEVREE